MGVDRSIFTLLSLLLLAACGNQPGDPGTPNIIVLFADDLGYGDLSSYGHPTIVTPHIDGIAADGMRFTSFYSGAPSCTPSRAAILTGRYGKRIGLPAVLMPASQAGMPDDELTMAEMLRARGYRTGMVGKWHLGHADPASLPTRHGFDSWFGLPYSNDMIRPWVQTDVPLQFYRDETPLDDPPVVQSELTVRYTREAVGFIDRSANDPFFLYLAYSMPHLPIAAPDSMLGRSRAGLYGDVIEMIDWSVGEVLAALDQHGLSDRTIVVFTSDNGPWLGLPDRMLQDGIVPWHAGFPGPLRGWKGNTYEGGQRVPAVIRWPGIIDPGSVTAEPASVLDLMPTFARAVGVELPSDRIIDGRDLTSLLDGSAIPPERPFFYIRDGRVEAVRDGRWKLRLSRHMRPNLDPDSPIPPELFDLEVDPSERFDRATELPAITARLVALLDSAAAAIAPN